MNIVNMAEFLSAFAAFITVCLTATELSSRRRLKKAEDAIKSYSKYLIIDQQTRQLITGIHSFMNNFHNLTHMERQSYAKSHLPDPAVLQLILSVVDESITNFNYNSKIGKTSSQTILDASSLTMSLIESITTFYQAILDHENYPVSSIERNYKFIADACKQLPHLNYDAEKILRQNLKTVSRSSTIYILSLIFFSVFFLFICFILGRIS